MPRKRNVYATYIPSNGLTLPLDHMFSQYIEQPDYILHSKSSDEKQILDALINNTSSRVDTRELDEVNDLIYDTTQKQAFYILRKVGKITGKSDYVESELKKVGKEINGYRFKEIIEQAKKYPQKDGEDKKELSTKEINDIISESSLEENIGEGPKELEHFVKYERTERTRFCMMYRMTVQNAIMNELGYSKGDLDKKFSKCIDEDNEIDYDELKKARKEFLQEKMQALDIEDRNETNFIKESNKLEIALNAYVFDKCRDSIDKDRFYDVGSRKEFTEFAISTTDPRATSKQVKENFDNIFKDQTAETDPYIKNENLEKALTCINRLKQVHKARPFFTRFVDYFRSNGEDSTIKKMQKQLTTLGYSKEEIKDVSKNPLVANASFYKDITVDDRFDTYTSGEYPIATDTLNELKEKVIDFNNRITNFEHEKEEMKEQITNDIAPEINEEKIIEEKQTDKTFEKETSALIE